MSAPQDQDGQARATPEVYSRVFVDNPEGALILEDLTARFHDRQVYVQGGIEAERETAKRAAENGVIGFILRRVAQIHDRPNNNEGESDV